MQFKKYCLVFLGLLFISTFSGCISIPSPTKEYDAAAGITSPETVLKKITERHQDIIKAIANIEVNHATERYVTKVAVLLKIPSSLRVEAIPIIGPAPFFLSVHEDILKAFLPQRGSFYIGKATPENIGKIVNFLPAGLSIEDVVSIMLGTYPGINEENVILKGFGEGRLYRIDMMTEGRKVQSLWVDLSNDHLVEVQIFKECDRISYAARFEEFDKPGPIATPLKITITSEMDDHQKVIIRYSSIQPATDVEDSAFDLQMPPDLVPIHLD